MHVSGWQHVAGASRGVNVWVDACSDLSFVPQHHMDVCVIICWKSSLTPLYTLVVIAWAIVNRSSLALPFHYDFPKQMFPCVCIINCSNAALWCDLRLWCISSAQTGWFEVLTQLFLIPAPFLTVFHSTMNYSDHSNRVSGFWLSCMQWTSLLKSLLQSPFSHHFQELL